MFARVQQLFFFVQPTRQLFAVLVMIRYMVDFMCTVYFVMDLIEIFSEGVNTSQIYLLDYVLLGSTILLY